LFCEIEDHRGEAVVLSKGQVNLPPELLDFTFLFTKSDNVILSQHGRASMDCPVEPGQDIKT
jgi:hypothetical protein